MGALCPAPAYSPGDVVRHGDAKALKAWQAGEELEREFGLLISAWRASFKAEARKPGARVDVREVDQCHHFWARPELVANDLLNGTRLNRYGHPLAINPTLLGVASEPADAAFRLVTVGELAAIFAEQLQGAKEARPMGRTRRAVAF
jgi:hypothetical protein